MTSAGTDMQTEWSEAELLASHRYAEPLVVDGVRCHGGFDEGGAYRSPRTLNRVPAIEAWQAAHAEQFDAELLDLELSAWPGHYPNIPQARYLVEQGVREPIIAILTRIGTVEGFGSMIRQAPVPALEDTFVEDTRGTALSHLTRGLFEAHARDEAGHGAEGGHRQMWFVARDVAFEHPVTEDQTEVMLERMGITGPHGAPPNPVALRRQLRAERLLDDDIDLDLELMVNRMARLLLIEISAFHTFAWAEELLADRHLVAGEGAAARMVAFIRADETPHVEYLKTVLSEIRDRTVIGSSGRRHTGAEVVMPIWERARVESLGPGRDAVRTLFLRELEHAVDGDRRRDDLLEEFHQLGSVRPGPDGEWVAA